MIEMEQIRISEVQETILLTATGYSRTDSTGYRNAMKKLIKELKYLERTTQNKKTIYKLTSIGRNYLLSTGALVIPDAPKSNGEYHAQLKQTLGKIVSAPTAKLDIIFDALKDGAWHSVSELLLASGYGRTDSSGYKNIMAGMKKLDLLEKSGKKTRFTDEAFNFGRPVDQKQGVDDTEQDHTIINL